MQAAPGNSGHSPLLTLKGEGNSIPVRHLVGLALSWSRNHDAQFMGPYFWRKRRTGLPKRRALSAAM